ncbi:MAG TPA: ABC transporter permease [Candidatus Glassbacteria bacterium]|nr:ABC transporter permease [Candidatus Glassbacteria bacterium]
MFTLFQRLGERIIRGFFKLGQASLLIGRVAGEMPHLWSVRQETVSQMIRIGVGSLPLVAVTSLFTGMVLAVQTSYQIKEYVPELFIAAAICKATIIELGPVITALVISGRVGASITAELGTMRVTEQIDALETMALDPVRFLLLPRFVAGLVMMPVIVTYGCLIAIAGGYAVCLVYLDITSAAFFQGVRQFLYPYDLYSGLFKSFVFGGTVSLVGCYYGYCTSRGAEGVGRSTTESVVTNCLLILIFDYILAMLLFPTA